MTYEQLLGEANSCDVSDACDRLGVTAARSGVIRPAYPGCPRIVGRVWTLSLVPGGQATLAAVADALAGAAPIGADVALVDLAGRTDVQCWGTVLATAARLYGVRAAVVNGAVRDVDGLAGLGFPTAAAGVHPAAMRGRLSLAAAGATVLVAGVAVAPGWAVVADANGVVAFAADRAEEVFAVAAQTAGAEGELLRRVREAGDVASAHRVLREG